MLSAQAGDRGIYVGFILGIRRGLIAGLVAGAAAGYGINGGAGVFEGAASGAVLFIASSTVIGWIVGSLARRVQVTY